MKNKGGGPPLFLQECGNFGFFDPPSCGILLSSIGPMRKAGQTMKERRPAPSGEADGIIADTPDFTLWAEGVDGVRAAADDFARRYGF